MALTVTTRRLKVQDAVMGSGKTSKFFFTADKKGELFVTPFLDECDRAEEHGFYQPEYTDEDTKTESFISLLATGENIACTHSLFLQILKNPNVRDLVMQNNYKLTIDETLPVISQFNSIRRGDAMMHVNAGNISVDTNNFGKMEWVSDNLLAGVTSPTSVDEFVRMQDHLYGAVHGQSVDILYVESSGWFDWFKSVELLTYQFVGTEMYAWCHIKNIQVNIHYGTNDKSKTNKLINLDLKNKNYRQTSRYALTATWWGKANKDHIKRINSVIRSLGRTHAKDDSVVTAYTVPKDALGTQREGIQPNGYPHTVYLTDPTTGLISKKPEHKCKKNSCHISCNTRASNDYAHKTLMIHIFNRYPTVEFSRWISEYQLPFDSEVFALNELLQWSWRGCIRTGAKMDLIILSKRMRELFIKWSESV